MEVIFIFSKSNAWAMVVKVHCAQLTSTTVIEKRSRKENKQLTLSNAHPLNLPLLTWLHS